MVAPAASVAIVSKLDEVDGSVMFAGPLALDHSVLVRINLDECAGPDQRIQGIVVGPDVSIENFAGSGVLRQEERHFTQAPEHPMDKVRPFEQGLVRQFHGRRDDRLHLRNGARAEVSVRECDQASLMVQITDVKPAERQDLSDIAAVDEAEAVELRQAGLGSSVLKIAHPIVGDVVCGVVLFLYDSLAEFLDVADGQMSAFAFRAGGVYRLRSLTTGPTLERLRLAFRYGRRKSEALSTATP